MLFFEGVQICAEEEKKDWKRKCNISHPTKVRFGRICPPNPGFRFELIKESRNGEDKVIRQIEKLDMTFPGCSLTEKMSCPDGAKEEEI